MLKLKEAIERRDLDSQRYFGVRPRTRVENGKIVVKLWPTIVSWPKYLIATAAIIGVQLLVQHVATEVLLDKPSR